MEPIDRTSVPNIKSVLLLGANNILALPVIRALGTQLPNAEIHTLSYRNGENVVPEHSRFVSARHYLEAGTEDELFKVLLEKIKETEANILLPIDEQDVKQLSVLKDKLEKYVHLPPLPSAELFDSLVYKNRLVELLKQLDLPYATTYDLNENNIENIDESVFPALLKPVRGSSGNGIKKVGNRNNLEIMLEGVDSEKYILQELIPGQKYICNLLAIDGEIHALNIQEGLESRNFSFSTAIKFIEHEPIAGLTKKLIRDTNYSGLANIDYQVDERDDKAKLIDFNPRFWSSLSGSKAAGIDFTLLACLAALGEPLSDFTKAPSLKGNIYHMGRSTLKHFVKRAMKPFTGFQYPPVNTDLKERLTDPVPEFFRLIH